MINLQRILVATDFSPHSQVALRYAKALAEAFHAEVVICHVLENPDLLSQLPPVDQGYFPPNFLQLQEEQAQVGLSKLAAEAGPLNVRTLLRHGAPFVEIVAAAREEAADLIVIGTHGRGAIAHMLLGSVAEKVVRKAACPVLTVREGEHDFVRP